MPILEMVLDQRALCPCGHTVLRNEIGLGTRYLVDPTTVDPGAKMICGGCKNEIRVTLVLAMPRTQDQEAGWLPLDIFKRAVPLRPLGRTT